jgi:hypothetical protein
VEKARQHPAVRALYWISTLLFGASVLLLIIGFVAPIPEAGNAIVLVMFAALTTRFLFFLVLFWQLQEREKSAAKLAAIQCTVWFLGAAAFFTFVVLYQFRNLA